MINVGNVRHLSVSLVHEDIETTEYLMQVVQNLDASVRDGVLGRFAARVIDGAKDNLREHTQKRGGKTATGSQGRLARTIKMLRSSGDTIRIGYGGNLPYARIHDKPESQGHVIRVVSAPRLVYPDRRSPITPHPLLYAKMTHRPTSGYMTEAVKSAKKHLSSDLREEVDLMQSSFENTPFVITSKGGVVQRFGSTGLEGAIKKGYVKRSPSNRRDLLLTEAGLDYVKRRQRKKRKQ